MTQHEIEDDDPIEDIEVDDVEDEVEDQDLDTGDPEPEPPTATTPEPPVEQAGATPMDSALAGLNSDLRAETIRRAAGYGVVHADDPLWTIIRAVSESAAAGKAAVDAAAQARQAVARLDEAPEQIERAARDGASRAAAEIQQHAAEAAQAVVATISTAIEQGAAEPVGKVMRPHLEALDGRVHTVRDEVNDAVERRVKSRTDEFLRNVNRVIRSKSTASKTAGRLSALLLLALGAALGIAGAQADHHLAPMPVHDTPAGGYQITVPQGFGGRFRRCGSRECVYLYPSRARRAGGHK